jgi:non-specific serine/threonine protein kinase/serine/threonine-protein kinase
LLREVLDAHCKAGAESDYSTTAANLAGTLNLEGKLEEADRILGEALDRTTNRLGPNNQEVDRLRWIQIRNGIDRNRGEEAMMLGRDALAQRSQSYPAGHPMIGAALMDHGRGLVMLGKLVEAEVLLAESVAIFGKSSAPMPHYPAWAECWYGASLAGQRRYAEAEPHLLKAETRLREARTRPRRYYRQAVEQLVKLYQSWNKPDQAAQWQKELMAFVDLQGPSEGKGGATTGSGR